MNGTQPAAHTSGRLCHVGENRNKAVPRCRSEISIVLFQEKANQPVVPIAVRLIPHRQIDPSLFIHDALVVGEGVESGLSVISAHAAGPDPSETHPARFFIRALTLKINLLESTTLILK